MTLSSIERLDLVAKSKTTDQLISYARAVLLILGLVFALLAVNSTAGRLETLLVWVLTASSFLTALVLWLDWRFKVFSLSLLCFLFAAGNVLTNDRPHSHTLLGWIAANSLTLLFAYYGCGVFVMARRYASVNDNKFIEEREQLENWLQQLRGVGSAIEFPSGSFWTGYWTYRMWNPGGCWVIAQFKRGTTKLRTCRVYESKDVSITQTSSGKWQVDIAGKRGRKKTFAQVELTSASTSAISPITRPMNA